MNKYCNSFIFIISAFFSSVLFAATPGTLDTTFNAAGALPGTQRTEIDTPSSFGFGVAMQADGKIVSCGTVIEGGINKFAVARLNGNGLLDGSFNASGSLPGTVSTAIDAVGNPCQGFAVAVNSADDTIVVAGFVRESGVDRFAVARFNPDGSLDTTFNAGGGIPGTVSTAIDNAANPCQGYSVEIQPDSKIVVGGYVTQSGVDRFAVARFNTNGSLDTTFNAGGSIPGTVSTAIDNVANPSFGTSVKRQSDGKIVMGGFVTESGVNKFALARFNSNGSLDTTTFNSGGSLPGTVSTFVDNPTKPVGIFAAIAIQSDGKIVMGGQVLDTVNSIFKFAAARFNTNGSLDTTTYNSGGSLPGTVSYSINSSTQSSVGTSVVLASSDKIVIAGYIQNGLNLPIDQFAVLRLDTDGSLDTTFNPGGTLPGTASTGFIPPSTNVPGYAVTVDGDDAIVMVGAIDEGNGFNKFAFARFDPNGSLDTTFNASGALPGTQRTAIDLDTQSIGFGIAMQSNGKIVSTGVVIEGGINRFAVARLNNNGLLDGTFNTSGSLPGTVSTAIDNIANPSVGAAVAIQSDGKIVTAGRVTSGGLNKFAVARFNTNGSLDTTFNSGGGIPGTVSTAIDNAANSATGNSVALQSDGKIVVAGTEISGGLPVFAVARFNTNGSLDTTFNSGGGIPGTVSTAIDNVANPSTGVSVAIQLDGKIVVSGIVTEAGVSKFAVARFNSNGSLDTTTFNSGGSLPGTVSTFVDSPTKEVDFFAQVALQRNGKIVIGGDVFDDEESIFKFAAVRFKVDGTLDTTFNSGGSLPGTVSYSVNSPTQDSVGTSVAIQRNDQIVLGGWLNVNNSNIANEFALIRLNPNGLLDATFNPSGSLPGTVSTVFVPASDAVFAYGVTIQSDNKIVMVGSIDESTPSSQFAFARFNGELAIVNICTA